MNVGEQRLGDTLGIAVSELRTRDGRRITWPASAQPVFPLPAEQVSRVERLGNRPMSAALVAGIATTFGIFALLGACSATGCFR